HSHKGEGGGFALRNTNASGAYAQLCEVTGNELAIKIIAHLGERTDGQSHAGHSGGHVGGATARYHANPVRRNLGRDARHGVLREGPIQQVHHHRSDTVDSLHEFLRCARVGRSVWRPAGNHKGCPYVTWPSFVEPPPAACLTGRMMYRRGWPAPPPARRCECIVRTRPSRPAPPTVG